MVNKYGTPDILKYEKTVSKKIKNRFVRIKFHSIGVNFADILTIKGKYQERPRPPFSPGLEVSGEIIENGKFCNNFNLGEKVMAIMKYGGYQTEVLVPEENVYENTHVLLYVFYAIAVASVVLLMVNQ